MRKEKSRDAARSRRSKENHEFYELAKLLPLPAAITSQLDFLDKASIIRLTISFLKLRQFSVNGHPPWAPDFTTLGSANPYTSSGSGSTRTSCGPSSVARDETSEPNGGGDDDDAAATTRKSLVATPPGNSITPSNVAFHTPGATVAAASQPPHPANTYQQLTNLSLSEQQSVRSFIKTNAASLFDVHQGTHILQSLDGFAFAIGRDGRFLYISETVSMYLGLSQVEMTGSSVFDYTHQQDHAELARQLGISYTATGSNCRRGSHQDQRDSCSPRPPGSVQSQYSAASNETSIDDHMTYSAAAVARKRMKTATGVGRGTSRPSAAAAPATAGPPAKTTKKTIIKSERQEFTDQAEDTNNNHRLDKQEGPASAAGVRPTNGIISGGGADSAGAPQAGAPPRAIEGDPLVRQFCIRMKSTLTKRGCQHFKSSGYRVVHVVAHLRSYQSNDHGHLMDPLDDPRQAAATNSSDQTLASGATPGAVAPTAKSSKQGKRRGSKAHKANASESKSIQDDPTATTTTGGDYKTGKLKIIGMVAVAIALPPPSINELRLESDTFVLRLGLDLKITHVEPKITELLNYPMELLAGRSLYSFIHPADLEQARTCHRDLLQKGQMMSGYYRLLARTGGFIWIQTCATLICNSTTAATTLGPPSAPGPASSMSSPSPHLQQQQQLMMSDNEQVPLVISGRGAPGHQPIYFPRAGTPTLSATSFESQIMGQHPGQFQTQVPPPPSQQQQHQQQEQCVIFVNYMITNVIETQEILDVCQSKDFMPLQRQLTNFSGLEHTAVGNGNHHQQQQQHTKSMNSKHDNESTTNEYRVSPGSSCSSPCPAAAATATATAGGNSRAAASGSSVKTPGNGGAYLSTHTPSIINLSSSSSQQQQQQAARHWRHSDQHQASSRHTTGGTSSKASRRQAAKGSRAQHEQSQSQAVYSGAGAHAAAGSTSESGFGGRESSPVGAVASYAAAAAAAAAVAAASASTYDTAAAAAAARAFQPPAYATSAADECGAANPLALQTNKHSNQLDPTSANPWHQHQQQQPDLHHHQHAYLAASHHTPAAIYPDASSNSHQQVAAQAASDHYLASMDRSSIYKAATFAAAGLAASAAGSYAAAYPSVAAATYHHHPHSHPHPLSQQLEQHEQQHQQHQQYHNHHHHQHHSSHHHTQQQYQQSQHVAASQQHYQAAAAAATVYSAAHQHHPPWF